ncbi:MAG TPA: hypothetical protein H9741_07125 [Candidatus Borkfalkia faecipullorum]|uniref:Uncharacterized protein n=1 Tax=Candidatus Borkfalkia faecipullorum TaxID=2838510 RepID=A0A9D1V8Y0_9FIRM|nr:hypothetical protein [Candidatus Borkfalkia faecipullorum]
MLLSETMIGQGCIVVAGAVIKKNFALNNRMIAGIPEKNYEKEYLLVQK